MKMILAAACCLFLTGCGGFVFPGPGDGAVMQGGPQVYAPATEGGLDQPSAGNQITSTCTMRGRGVVCR